MTLNQCPHRFRTDLRECGCIHWTLNAHCERLCKHRMHVFGSFSRTVRSSGASVKHFAVHNILYTNWTRIVYTSTDKRKSNITLPTEKFNTCNLRVVSDFSLSFFEFSIDFFREYIFNNPFTEPIIFWLNRRVWKWFEWIRECFCGIQGYRIRCCNIVAREHLAN